LDNFDTQIAYAAVSNFFEILNNWYIRRSRNRFWKSEKDEDKQNAYNTLYTCLEVMSCAMSSLLPLISEEIYLGLTGKQSVHLTNFPVLDMIDVEDNLVNTMDQVLDICSNALFIRSVENIRVRQPIYSLTIISKNNEQLRIFEELIKDEVNVKSIIYRDDLENEADLRLVINFPVVGKRLPHKMKDIITANKKNEWQVVADKLDIAGEKLEGNEFSVVLAPKDAKGAKALTHSQGLIILDLVITQELHEEGIARDLVRFIQQARKDANFSMNDRLLLEITTNYDIKEILAKHGDFICTQTLGQFAKDFEPNFVSEVEIDSKKVTIRIKKI